MLARWMRSAWYKTTSRDTLHKMASASPRWEHFDHEADIGVRGFGSSPEEAFEQAALAMTAVVCDPDTIKTEQTIEVVCYGQDLELLLIDWLNALVYEMATRRMLFGQFKVEISTNGLTASVKGEEVDVARHQPAVEIKGATFTLLKVAQDASGQWIAQTIVDV
jgi:SHS2 domain-containing protein